MQLDPEGHLIMGGRHFLPVSVRSLCDDGKTTTGSDDLPVSFPSVSCSTPWERNAARLCQRVKDVQALVQEDLREIDEPLTTFGGIAQTLTQEYITQWEIAKTAYEQALLECSQVLARILLPFAETQEPIEQSAGCVDEVLFPMETVSR